MSERDAARGRAARVVRRVLGTRRLPSQTSTAVLVERLAVLLGAGVAPASAWAHVGSGEPPGVVHDLMLQVAAAARRGRPVSDSLLLHLREAPFALVRDGDRHDRAWHQVACAWRVAERSGAPLADCLLSFVLALRAADDARRDVQVALSGPRSAARVVLALPPVGLLFSLGMGFDTGAVLTGTPVGLACIAVSGGLVGTARWWNGRLIRSADPGLRVPGLRLELVAVALSGGGSWPAGLATVDDAVATCLRSPRRADRVSAVDPPDDGDDDDRRRCVAVLDLSRRAGAPAGLLLRSEARERRQQAQASARSAAARLGVTLMLPLGVCILPAFLVIGVVPLVVSLVSSTTVW